MPETRLSAAQLRWLGRELLKIENASGGTNSARVSLIRDLEQIASTYPDPPKPSPYDCSKNSR